MTWPVHRMIEELRGLLLEWDPLGMAEVASDEYDCLLGPIIGKLRDGVSARGLGDFLEGELIHHFGVFPQPSRPRGFAQRLVTWYAGRCDEPQAN
jgi:hypothetical protein